MRYVIELPSVLESLRVAAPFSDAVLQELPDLPDRRQLIHDLALVSSEALTNAFRYCEQSELPVRLEYRIEPGGITITVTDHGPGFDPDAVALPDFDRSPEGGYGIYIIRTLVDSVRYEQSGDGNSLILTKSWENR